jgi:carbamoyltransferase
MARTFGVYGPSYPWLKLLGDSITLPLLKALGTHRKFYTLESEYARERIISLKQKLHYDKPIYLLGIALATHNTGIALIEVSSTYGVRLLFNNEEERYTGVKHSTEYPEHSIEALRLQMSKLGIGAEDIHACLANFDYIRLYELGKFLEEFPASLTFLLKYVGQDVNRQQLSAALMRGAKRLGSQLELKGPLPIIGLRHHDNHAYFSYGVSPFARSEEPVMVAVIDGAGDDSAISLYVGRNGKLELIYNNRSMFDSLGLLYGYISSTQGGWPMLSSEGRYMGAAAWGNYDRLTNPFYRQLRQLIYFGNKGQIYLNRALANWHRRGLAKPYTDALIEILGPPISSKNMWNPDAVLKVENIEHAEITIERVDKAAATQLLFEDVMFHIIENLIRVTRSHKLVLTGGCALNCLANMQLIEHFDETYYERYFGQKNTRLHLWIPPTPGDAGTTMGAAYYFALANGAPLGEPLNHAFYCGSAPTSTEIKEALDSEEEVEYLVLGNLSDRTRQALVADLVSYIVSKDGVVGIFQGVAETGPRALGHRSIVANPCNPQIRETMNKLIKHREMIRPLAPMATYEAAHRWFVLSPGASEDNYNAYNYMTLTARARPESYTVIPAVIHKDGTSRVQIVREETDPFTYAYLKAMGRRVGVEVSVNTSLNVGSPIVQTPIQAISALKRSRGMDGLFFISDEGSAFLAWHNIFLSPKDAGQRLKKWMQAWQNEMGFSFS